MLGVLFQGLSSSPPTPLPFPLCLSSILKSLVREAAGSAPWFLCHSQILLATKERRVARGDSASCPRRESLGNRGKPPVLVPAPRNLQMTLCPADSLLVSSEKPKMKRKMTPSTKTGPDPTPLALSQGLTVEGLGAQQHRLTRGEVTQPQSTLGNLLCASPEPSVGF